LPAHIKVTLLGYAIKSYCLHKGTERHTSRWGNPNKYPNPAPPRATTGESSTLPKSSPPLGVSQALSSLRGVTAYSAARFTMGCRVKALGDCTSPVMGCLGEEPKEGRSTDQSNFVIFFWGSIHCPCVSTWQAESDHRSQGPVDQ